MQQGLDPLNNLRMLAGISVKSAAPERKVLNEARDVPMARHHLAPVNAKTMESRAQNVAKAARHVEQAIKALEKVPATDFMGDVPHMINQLEEMLGQEDAAYGLRAIVKTFTKEHRKSVRAENTQKAEEEELTSNLDDEVNVADEKRIVARSLDAEIEEHGDPSKLKEGIPAGGLINFKPKGAGKKKKTPDDGGLEVDFKPKGAGKKMKKTDESTLNYNPDSNALSWGGEDEPVNTISTSEVPTAYPTKPGRDESPEQMVNAANEDPDYSRKIPVPQALKTSLRTEIDELRKEFEKYKTRDENAATMYNTSADALESILGHLNTGTVGGLKQAAIFMPTLMSPIMHKIPTDVVDFIARGGANRSLKQHFYKVKDQQGNT